MQDHVSRLVGLDSFRVKGVVEDGDQLACGADQAVEAGPVAAVDGATPVALAMSASVSPAMS
jgi:hypothetical protein